MDCIVHGVAKESDTTEGLSLSLTIWTFVGKVMSPFFNTLSRFVIDFLSRDKHLLIFVAVVTLSSDFGALENKIFHCFYCFPIYMP